MANLARQISISIVVPVWNRRDTIRRCLDSILSQNFQDYEVIAVDDASTDDSVAVMESYGHPKLSIIKLEENSGVCAARGAGTARAKAPWILYVDSDDALEPGTLSDLYKRTLTAPADVGVLGYCYREDNGTTTPYPPYPEGPFGLVEYMEREEKASKGGSRNFSYCIRREVFDTLSWPTDRQFESRIMLQIVDRWKWDISRRIGSTVYSDAHNRYSDKKQNIKRYHITASDNIKMTRAILSEYGSRLKKYCPTRYAVFFRSCATLHFYIGKRWLGLKYMSLYLWRKPFSLRGWLILLFGLLGPEFLFWAKGKE
jgi:glycosyltransferase involved in cell wall biosynthesis